MKTKFRCTHMKTAHVIIIKKMKEWCLMKILAGLILFLVVACGSKEEQCSKHVYDGDKDYPGCEEYAENKDADKPQLIEYPLEVETRYELPYCRAEGYGKKVLAKDSGIYYECNNDIWSEKVQEPQQ